MHRCRGIKGGQLFSRIFIYFIGVFFFFATRYSYFITFWGVKLYFLDDFTAVVTNYLYNKDFK